MSIRDVNPAFFDRITAQPDRLCERETYTYGYGNPLRDPSNWTVMELFSARMKSIGESLAEMGVDIYAEAPEPPSDALGRERDAPWGFAAGDRVRMTTLGYIGRVTSSEGCPFSDLGVDDGPCRRICPNVTFNATHRLSGAIIETVTEGPISCPPNDLEHCD